jgi:glutamyl-tRNA synthetase
MSMDELISKFSFEHCSKAGAKFAYEKGMWFNHMYLQQLSDAELAELYKPELTANGVNVADFSDEYIARVVSLVKSRITFVKDLWAQSAFFFTAPTSYDAKAVKKRWSAEMPDLMRELIGVLKGIEDFSSAAAEPIVLGWITDKGYHMGNVMNAFRLTVVGECKGPHMFDITELIGKDETIRRIEAGIERIKSDEPAL